MPPTKFIPDDFSIKKLYEKTDLSGFACTESDDLGLNEFIHKEALGYQREHMGVTYLFHNDDRIAGYITVAMGSISVKMTKLCLDIFGARGLIVGAVKGVGKEELLSEFYSPVPSYWKNNPLTLETAEVAADS